MLNLDSPRWAELTQAYGSAEDVPRVIGALSEMHEPAARAELWFALWRMLLRDDAVFVAAYATAPYLLALAADRPLAERAEAAQLLTRIELLRRAPASPAMPSDLVAPYAAAVEALPRLVASCADEPWDAEVAQILTAALLVGKRQAPLANAVLELGAPRHCEQCGAPIDMTSG